MRFSTLRGTFCSLINLATPIQDWTGSNPSRREGGSCGSTLLRSHSCCAVRPVYIQISPGHIWTTLYINEVLHYQFAHRKIRTLTFGWLWVHNANINWIFNILLSTAQFSLAPCTHDCINVYIYILFFPWLWHLRNASLRVETCCNFGMI